MYDCVSHVCLMPVETRRGHSIPWPGVREGCEPPYGCSDSNLGPLVEQPVLLAL